MKTKPHWKQLLVEAKEDVQRVEAHYHKLFDKELDYVRVLQKKYGDKYKKERTDKEKDRMKTNQTLTIAAYHTFMKLKEELREKVLTSLIDNLVSGIDVNGK